MSRSFYSLFAILSLAVSAIVAVPRYVLGIARDFVDAVLTAFDPRAVADLFRDAGSTLAVDGPGGYIEPSLLNEQRHEAGLARLGAVRHR